MTVQFLGPYDWRNQRPPDRAAPGITPTAYYQRFPIAQIRAGALVTWLKALPAGAIVGIRIQELVGGTTALPSGHGIPGAYDNGLRAFVPDYNSPQWLALIRATLQTAADQLRGYALGRVDIAYGNWGEGHTYGMEAGHAALRPSDSSLHLLGAMYTDLFPLDTLYAPIGNDVLLRAAHAAGVRGAFCDGWGLIDGNGRDHAERYWLDPWRAEILEDMRIVGETGSSNPANLNFQWMADSIERHTNVLAFGNGNIPYAALTPEQQRLFVRCLTIVAERRAAILATPGTDLAAELAAAKVEIARLNGIIKQQAATSDAHIRAIQSLRAANAIATTALGLLDARATP